MANIKIEYTAKNIDMAVNSCKSESGNLLTNRQQMQRVKESLNDGYCDISGRKGDLHHIGNCFAEVPLFPLNQVCFQVKWGP